MRLIFFLFLTILAAPSYGVAQTDVEGNPKSNTGLPIPRFASLRSDEVNMRTGPGTRYPIEWVLKRQGMPVEITAEYDIWRRVRDWEGAEGWVHKMALTGKRTVIITGTTRDLKKSEDIDAPIIAHLEVGSVGQIISCAKDLCRLKFDDIKGYLSKTDFWGAYPNEKFN